MFLEGLRDISYLAFALPLQFGYIRNLDLKLNNSRNRIFALTLFKQKRSNYQNGNTENIVKY